MAVVNYLVTHVDGRSVMLDHEIDDVDGDLGVEAGAQLRPRRLLDALDRLGLSDNTIVVFWSDHGYHLGEHNGIWQKRTLFEEAARSPLIIRKPKAAGNGRACSRVVEFVDIYPTVAALAKISAPGNLDGRSLDPLLENPGAPWDGFAVTQILRPADGRLSAPVMGRSIRTERWRYTEWDEGRQGVELYDHRADPREFRNLSVKPDAAARAAMKALRSRLEPKASGVAPKTPFNPKRL